MKFYGSCLAKRFVFEFCYQIFFIDETILFALNSWYLDFKSIVEFWLFFSILYRDSHPLVLPNLSLEFLNKIMKNSSRNFTLLSLSRENSVKWFLASWTTILTLKYKGWNERSRNSPCRSLRGVTVTSGESIMKILNTPQAFKERILQKLI